MIKASFLGAIISLSSLAAWGGQAFYNHGPDPKSKALGLSSLGLAPYNFSLAVNPAVMSGLDKAELGLSSNFTDLRLEDTKAVYASAPASGMSRDSYSASEAETLIGGTFALNLKVSKKVSIGLAGYMSQNALARLQAQTGNTANYLLFDDRSIRPEFFTAFSYKLSPSWSLGLGLSYTFKADGKIELAASQNDADSRLFIELRPSVVPYGGVYWETRVFSSKLFGSLYARMAHESNTDLSVDVSASTRLASLPFNAGSSLMAYYDPAAVGLGLGHKRGPLGIYGRFEYKLWSKYIPPIVDLKGQDIEDLSVARDKRGEVDLNDNWDLSLGAEYKDIAVADLWVTPRVGLQFHRAVTSNSSSLSILDTHYFGWSQGLGVKSKWVNILFKRNVDFSFSLGQKILKKKTFSSSSTIEGASAGGSVWDLGLGVSFEI